MTDVRNAYTNGELPPADLKGIRSYTYRFAKIVRLAKKVKRVRALVLTKEGILMGIIDRLVPGLGLAKTIIEMVPKGNRRKAGAALAQQLELQLQSTADLVTQIANSVEEPMMRLALLQHASHLAGMQEIADSISDILIGEDDEPGKG